MTNKKEILQGFYNDHNITWDLDDGKTQDFYREVYDHIVESLLNSTGEADGAEIMDSLEAIHRIGAIVETQCKRLKCPGTGHGGLAQTNLLSRIIKGNYLGNEFTDKTMVHAIADIDRVHLKGSNYRKQHPRRPSHICGNE